MAIPDFQSIMLPLLKIVSDGEVHSTNEVIETLASQFKLTEDDRRELLPSGNSRRFNNRVGWARTHLKKAGLIEYPERGKYQITKRGLQVLESEPIEITVSFLKQFSGFMEFIKPVERITEPDQTIEQTRETPEEILESSYQSLRSELARDLLDRIKQCSSEFFENLVVDLLVAMGYGGSKQDAGQAVGRSGDGGIDGIIKEDRLGLDVVYIQAKRWEGTVGRPTVQTFAGSLDGQRARKGVLITTSRFSTEAKEYVGLIEKKIVLIDGEQLAQLMMDHSVGVSEIAHYVVKRVDQDYFEES